MLTNDQIINKLDIDIENIIPLTSKVYFIIDKDENKYIFKYINEHQFKMYEYLKEFQCNILYPKRIIAYKGGYYFLSKYLKQTYDDPVNLSKMINCLKDTHKKTEKFVTLKKDNEDKFLKISNVLNKRFTSLESIIRHIELKEKKEDYDLIILSKYRIFLLTKKVMYDLEQKIIQEIKNELKVAYVINMNQPSFSHFKDDKFISFTDCYYGIVVSDIARFYVEIDHLNIDTFSIIETWLSSYKDNFYKIYFKYLILYIYIINLKVDTLRDKIDVINYIEISNKLKKALHLFKMYE